MNVVVFGAGAIGSVYAAKLSAHHPVTVIGRPDHVAAIARDGLRVIGRESFTARVRAAVDLGALPKNTLCLLTTKVNDNRRAAAALATAVQPDTIVLCVQNGLGSEAVVKDVLAGRCLVLRAVTQFGAIFSEPGVVDLKVSGYTLIEAGSHSQAVADLLTASGLDGRVSPAINTEIWRKLIFNCVINPITSIVGSEVGGIADPRLDPLKRLVIDECLRVAAIDGVSFQEDFVRAIAETFGASRNIASMRQDLQRGRPTEIDFMNGAVVALGQQHGIDCPVNAALTAIIKAMEQARQAAWRDEKE
ncbi:MAG TPA: 2-dehydropantoate 2-reductase [Vicinamibacterales bacterium]|jgi:2-dehydropantoate 2-reductase|nr:2-dehydropantoate 2-reductase [Vicinamibacterales bacterium]